MYYFVVFTQFLVFSTTQVSLKKLITARLYLTNCIGLLYTHDKYVAIT